MQVHGEVVHIQVNIVVPNQPRRTTYAVLMTDVKKFSSLVSQSEEEVIDRVAADLKMFAQVCADHEGKVVADRGDGLKMIFESPVMAMKAALAMQANVKRTNAQRASGQAVVSHRMGLHFGDAMLVEDPLSGETKVTGHVVNVAARLEQRCDPGQVCYSDEVNQIVKRAVPFSSHYLGLETVKNIPDPVKVWMTWDEDPTEAGLPRKSVQKDPVLEALKLLRSERDEKVGKRRGTIFATLVAIIAICSATTVVVLNWPKLAPLRGQSEVSNTRSASNPLPTNKIKPSKQGTQAALYSQSEPRDPTGKAIENGGEEPRLIRVCGDSGELIVNKFCPPMDAYKTPSEIKKLKKCSLHKNWEEWDVCRASQLEARPDCPDKEHRTADRSERPNKKCELNHKDDIPDGPETPDNSGGETNKDNAGG